MKSLYLDTSVLVAGLSKSHPFHQSARQWLLSVGQNGRQGFASCHVLAECFATLTHPRYDFSIAPKTATALLGDSVTKKLRILPLSQKHYLAAFERCAAKSLGRAFVYDALHVEAALAAKCKGLATLNFEDFARLAEGETLKIIDVAEK